jgi:hypothetical protein
MDLSDDEELDTLVTVGGLVLIGLLDVQARRAKRRREAQFYLRDNLDTGPGNPYLNP